MTATAPSSYRIFNKLAYLLSARWMREILQTIFFIYLARQSAATYGEFMLALGLGSILIMVAEFGLNLPLVSLLGRKQGDPGKALFQVSLLKAVLLLLAAGVALGLVYWQDYSRSLKQVMLVLSAGVALEALASTFFTALQVQGRQKLEGQIKALGALLGFGYGLLTLILGASPLVVAWFKLIETLVNLCGAGAAVFTLISRPWRRLTLAGLGAVAGQGLVFALLELTAVTYNKANLFFLQRFAGAEAVAQYSVTWQMVDGFSCLAANMLLQSVLFPLFVQLWEVDKPEVARLAQDTAKWLLAAAWPLMFILAVESDRLITLIYGGQYGEAVWLQKWLVITIVTAFLHNLAAFLLISMRLERLLLFFYLAGLVLNLLWCSLAMPYLPLLGAALAMVLTKGGVALLSVTYAQRRLALIPFRAAAHLGAAIGVGLALYFLTRTLAPRELAEVLALAPALALAASWWRSERR